MSGFNSRGVVYLGARDYYDKRLPGGSEAVRAALPPEVAQFWDQIFLATTMYDALPIVEISRVAAEIVGVPHEEMARRNAEWLAERDIRGVYKMLLSAASPELVAVRLPRAASRYFDFGESSAKMVGGSVCRAEQRAMPQVMSSWFTACVNGFVPKALSMAGAQNPAVKVLGVTRDGEAHGMTTVTVSYEFAWQTTSQRVPA